VPIELLSVLLGVLVVVSVLDDGVVVVVVVVEVPDDGVDMVDDGVDVLVPDGLDCCWLVSDVPGAAGVLVVLD
jgi:hypothetical protein